MTEAWTKTNGFKERKKWRLFHATDFDSLIYPCFALCCMCGYFPYKRVSSGYTISRFRFIYFTLTVILSLAMSIYVEYHLIIGMSSANTIPKAMQQHFYFVIMSTILFVAYIQTRAVLHIFPAMMKVSSMLAPKDFDDLAKFIHTKDIGIFLFVILHLPNCVKIDIHVTIRNFASLYTMLRSVYILMFYIDCVCVLKACFAKVNEDIYQLKKPVSQKFLRNGQSTPTLLMKLKTFGKKHLLISNVVQILNKTFFLLIVVSTCMTFVSVTFNLYFYILWLNGGEKDLKYFSFWYVPYIPSAIFHFFKFALLIWACETATTQAVQIRVTLYDVLGEVSDMTMKREVEIFSLQLLHHEEIFSAKLIKPNGALLTQMLGGVALYILILIQFLLNTVVCMFKHMEL